MDTNRFQELKLRLQSCNATPGSFSKLNKLFNCPAQYKKQYIDKEKVEYVRGSTNQIVGSFIHKVLEVCVNRGFIAGFNNLDFLLIWTELVKEEKLLSADIDYANSLKEGTEAILNRVISLITDHKLKPYPELWISNWIKGELNQTYGKWAGGKGTLSNPDKFWQGSVDLVLIENNGWGANAVILDYKTYKMDSHTLDKYSYLQLLIYSYLVFIGFPKVNFIKYGTAVIPEGKIVTHGVLKREECEAYEQEIFNFLEDFITKITMYNKEEFYPHLKNDYCKYCSWEGSCKREAKFQCYNKKNKLKCRDDKSKCIGGCVNLK